jgi:hypothetical protein
VIQIPCRAGAGRLTDGRDSPRERRMAVSTQFCPNILTKLGQAARAATRFLNDLPSGFLAIDSETHRHY